MLVFTCVFINLYWSPEEIARAVAQRHRDRAAPYTGDMNEIPQRLCMPFVRCEWHWLGPSESNKTNTYYKHLTTFSLPSSSCFFPAPAPKSIPTSLPTSASSISQLLQMNSQSPNNTRPTSSAPSSPTSPYPSSYSSRPSTTSTSTKYPYPSFHQWTQVQTQFLSSFQPLKNVVSASSYDSPLSDSNKKESSAPATSSSSEGVAMDVTPDVPAEET